MEVDTVCLHGDSAEAVPIAKAIRAALQRAGVVMAPPG
jgi:lactam utilization protein B